MRPRSDVSEVAHDEERLAAILSDPTIAKLRSSLSSRRPVEAPEEAGVRKAAVALIFRAGDDGSPELLFIKRAEYPGDPWSGQIAFPGGREESGDGSLQETALRETREETGIDLVHEGMVIGVLDDLRPHTIRIPAFIVRPYVTVLARTEPLELSSEVALAFWIPIGSLAHKELWQEDTVTARGVQINARVFHHEDHVIWGMTERILAQLLELL